MAVSIAQMFVTVGADIAGATQGLQQVDSAMKRAASSIQSVGGEMAKGITAPLALGTAAVVGIGAEFERAFTRVRKTTGLAGDDLEKIRKGILDLSETSASGGKSAEELAQIAAVAGQLGIASKDLLQFTELAAGLSVATGITADQVAEDFARIATLTRTQEEDWQRLASTIVDLGNTMGGSERDIIELTNRLAGALSTVGVDPQQILGIAGAMAELGINAEAGGTAVSRFFLDMVKATAGAGQVSEKQATQIQNLQDRIADLGASLETARARQQAFGRNTPAAQVQQTADQVAKYERELGQARDQLVRLQSQTGAGGIGEFAKVAGISADNFKELVRTDPAAAFQAIVRGLGAIERARGPEGVVQALEDLGVNEARMTEQLLKLAGAEDVLARGLNNANTAWEENRALTDEVTEAMKDPTAQFNVLLNSIKRVAIDGFAVLIPHIETAIAIVREDFLPMLKNLVSAFAGLSPEVQRQILVFGLVAAAIGPALLALGLVAGVIGAILSPVGLLAIAVAALAAAWVTNFGDIQGKVMPILERLEFAFNFLRELVEPLGPVIASALGAVLPVLGKLGDLLGPAFGKGAELIGNHLKFVMGLLGRFVSFNLTIWGLIASIVGRVVREIGQKLEELQPFFQAVAGWVNQWLLTPLLELLKFIGSLIAQTGIGGVDVGGIVRQGELAVQQLSGQIAAGGPGGGGPTNVEVTINNPQVPDQTAAESFAAQVQNAVINALIDAEKQSEIPPNPGLPGQPIMPNFGTPF